MASNDINGLMVECIVATDVTRVRFPADAWGKDWRRNGNRIRWEMDGWAKKKERGRKEKTEKERRRRKMKGEGEGEERGEEV